MPSVCEARHSGRSRVAGARRRCLWARGPAGRRCRSPVDRRPWARAGRLSCSGSWEHRRFGDGAVREAEEVAGLVGQHRGQVDVDLGVGRGEAVLDAVDLHVSVEDIALDDIVGHRREAMVSVVPAPSSTCGQTLSRKTMTLALPRAGCTRPFRSSPSRSRTPRCAGARRRRSRSASRPRTPAAPACRRRPTPPAPSRSPPARRRRTAAATGGRCRSRRPPAARRYCRGSAIGPLDRAHRRSAVGRGFSGAEERGEESGAAIGDRQRMSPQESAAVGGVQAPASRAW